MHLIVLTDRMIIILTCKWSWPTQLTILAIFLTSSFEKISHKILRVFLFQADRNKLSVPQILQLSSERGRVLPCRQAGPVPANGPLVLMGSRQGQVPLVLFLTDFPVCFRHFASTCPTGRSRKQVPFQRESLCPPTDRLTN
jgi:hypothetical protein